MAESMEEVRGGGRFVNCEGGIGDVAAVDSRTSGTERCCCCCCCGLPLPLLVLVLVLALVLMLLERDFGTEGYVSVEGVLGGWCWWLW